MESLPDGSLGGILTVHPADGLGAGDLERFLALSRAKLGAGGVLVVETEDQAAAACGRPAPQALVELCRSTGFEQAYVLFPSGAGAEDPARAGGEFAIVASVLVPGRA
jgi:hypothetical protein